jgi:hypothetical protein
MQLSAASVKPMTAGHVNMTWQTTKIICGKTVLEAQTMTQTNIESYRREIKHMLDEAEAFGPQARSVALTLLDPRVTAFWHGAKSGAPTPGAKDVQKAKVWLSRCPESLPLKSVPGPRTLHTPIFTSFMPMRYIIRVTPLLCRRAATFCRALKRATRWRPHSRFLSGELDNGRCSGGGMDTISTVWVSTGSTMKFLNHWRAAPELLKGSAPGARAGNPR